MPFAGNLILCYKIDASCNCYRHRRQDSFFSAHLDDWREAMTAGGLTQSSYRTASKAFLEST